MSAFAFGFGDPCLPTPVMDAPSGPMWWHEVKHDGYRLMVRRTPSGIRIGTRRGYAVAKRIEEGASDYPMFEITDRALWQEHLARAEQRIVKTRESIARQRAVIEQLEAKKLETKTACELIAQFGTLLELQMADRDRLQKEMADPARPAMSRACEERF